MSEGEGIGKEGLEFNNAVGRWKLVSELWFSRESMLRLRVGYMDKASWGTQALDVRTGDA